MANRAQPIARPVSSVPAKKALPVAVSSSRGGPRRDFIETIWVLFCSVRFAIVLNVALALAVMLGTILPQIPPGVPNFPTELKNFLDGAQGRYGEVSGLLYWAGFYDLYNSLWFRMLIVLVVFGIIICTLNRWQPTMRLITRPMVRVGDGFLEGMTEKARFSSIPVEQRRVTEAITQALRKSRYRVVQESESVGDTVYLYADRDRWSKMITFVSHAALVLFILAAAGASNFGWREQSVYFFPGQPVNVGHELDYSVRNDGFAIEYYEDGKTVKEYRNTLAVVRDGADVLTKTIIVNDPLTIDSVNYFLVSYQPVVHVKGIMNGTEVALKPMGASGPTEGTVSSKGVLATFPGTSDDNQPLDFLQTKIGDKTLTLQMIYYQDVARAPGENPPIYVRAIRDMEVEKPLFEGFLPKTGAFTVPGYPDLSLSFTPDTATILEVAKDPGLGLIAVLFMVMATGFTLSLYTTFTRCWVKISPSAGGTGTDVLLAGVAEKNKVSFERDFMRLADRAREQLTISAGRIGGAPTKLMEEPNA